MKKWNIKYSFFYLKYPKISKSERTAHHGGVRRQREEEWYSMTQVTIY
jgi:hypothetical protein